MVGIVLVAKPSFLFHEYIIGARNGSLQIALSPNDWRHEYQKGVFFLFDLKSKNQVSNHILDVNLE